MKNSEIIEFIDRYCGRKEDIELLNTDLVYAILAHGYLYVKPGRAAEEFAMKVIKALKFGAVDGFESYLEDECASWSLEEWIRISMAKTALQVAIKAFDRRYFKKQIANLDPDEMCDKTLLDKYLNLMDKKQLLDFMNTVSYYGACYCALTNPDTTNKITGELHGQCYKANPSLSEIAYGLDYLMFCEENPYYIADYLSKEEIVDAIKRVILYNKSMAGHMARMFYYTNSIEWFEEYIELIGTYERTFHRDIYNPQIFYECL